MSHWVRTIESADVVADDGREAVRQARSRPGRIGTLILPADKAWSEVSCAPQAMGEIEEAGARPIDSDVVQRAASALRRDGSSTLLLLGGRALRAGTTRW